MRERGGRTLSLWPWYFSESHCEITACEIRASCPTVTCESLLAFMYARTSETSTGSDCSLRAAASLFLERDAFSFFSPPSSSSSSSSSSGGGSSSAGSWTTAGGGFCFFAGFVLSIGDSGALGTRSRVPLRAGAAVASADGALLADALGAFSPPVPAGETLADLRLLLRSRGMAARGPPRAAEPRHKPPPGLPPTRAPPADGGGREPRAAALRARPPSPHSGRAVPPLHPLASARRGAVCAALWVGTRG